MTVTDHFHNEHENPGYRCSSNMFTVSYVNPMILRRCQLREDGSVPTLATRSSIYAMGLGREFSLAELAALRLGSIPIQSGIFVFLNIAPSHQATVSMCASKFVLTTCAKWKLRMGLPPTADFDAQTAPAAEKMIGNAMHMACVGHVVGLGILVRCGLIRAGWWQLFEDVKNAFHPAAVSILSHTETS